MANLSSGSEHVDQTFTGPAPSNDQDDRISYISDLVNFAKGCEEKLSCLLAALGWSDGVQEGTQLVPCPLDPGHRVPTASLERHFKSCRLHNLGYSREDKAQMVDTTFFYEGKNVTAVNIDQYLQSQIIEDARKSCLQDNDLQKSRNVLREGDFSSHPVEVPETLDREMCTLTRADRIAIYDHVVLQANKANPRAEGSDDLYVDLTSKLKRDKGEPKEKSNLEVLAEMRDYKRRRQSYRAKNVHITRRSHTEIIREVIAVHTAELARIWKEDDEEEVKEEEEEKGEEDRISEVVHEPLSYPVEVGISNRIQTVRPMPFRQGVAPMNTAIPRVNGC
uniref:U11/U12 small nuclear ribonucleoprotein 48 kDa protein isoform X2 n=1 Tax=Myxine glutinosa TaxID=7769 RepID=UPI00358E2B39